VNILNEIKHTAGTAEINADGEIVRPETFVLAGSLKSEASLL